MQLLSFLPWALIFIGAFKAVDIVKPSERKLTKPMSVGLWVLALAVPIVAQAVAGELFAPPYKDTQLAWILYDIGLRMPTARFIAEVIFRTLGAVAGVGLVMWIVRRFLVPKELKSEPPTPS